MKSQNLINYSERKGKKVSNNNCILRNEFNGGYCNHPLIDRRDKGSLRCEYSDVDQSATGLEFGRLVITVPDECPLRKKSLIIKLESHSIK